MHLDRAAAASSLDAVEFLEASIFALRPSSSPVLSTDGSSRGIVCMMLAAKSFPPFRAKLFLLMCIYAIPTAAERAFDHMSSLFQERAKMEEQAGARDDDDEEEEEEAEPGEGSCAESWAERYGNEQFA
ncbi:unnamed protein product [Sphagnum tenellum]